MIKHSTIGDYQIHVTDGGEFLATFDGASVAKATSLEALKKKLRALVHEDLPEVRVLFVEDNEELEVEILEGVFVGIDGTGGTARIRQDDGEIALVSGWSSSVLHLLVHRHDLATLVSELLRCRRLALAAQGALDEYHDRHGVEVPVVRGTIAAAGEANRIARALLAKVTP